MFDFYILPVYFHFGYQLGTQEFKGQRFRVPYIEFTGEPNLHKKIDIDEQAPDKRIKFTWDIRHNEMGYPGKSIDQAPDSCIKILFFGGSTGYYGQPTIPALLEQMLNEKLQGKSVYIANCSVVSSNHNQHLHALVEQFIGRKIDMVIFYGGYNENIQPLSYDPRPGYPYNFYYNNECAPWRMNLVKYSSILGEIDKRDGIITGIHSLRKRYTADKGKWYRSIADNYFKTLEKARLISHQTLESTTYQQTKFVAIYQPFIVPEEFQATNKYIIQQTHTSDYIYDINNFLDTVSRKEVIFYDNIHVSQKGNELVATKLAEITLNVLNQK
ncbi:MAG: hypothetical protein U0T77_01600 [Chitinophagales bacterium]